MAPLNSVDSLNQNQLRIAVVGGGVIGVCSGLALQEAFPRAQVSILSDKWTPQTTGDVSAGLIYPYLIGSATRPCLVRRVLAESVKFYRELIKNPSSGKFGVSLITMYEVYRTATVPEIPDVPEVPDIREMSKRELAAMFPPEYKSGLVCTTYIAEPALMLPFLMDKFASKGGRLVTRKVSALNPLTSEFDLVINCTGLGSRYLSDVQDMTVESVRGQVIRVRAPWIRHAIMTDKYYVLPNRDCVVIGGTKDKGNYSLTADPQVAEQILAGCVKVIPSLRQAEKIADCVGLRPYRPAVRIEADPNYPRVIHNYGHGGSGVTMCWGSAVEVVSLAKEALAKNGLQSKL